MPSFDLKLSRILDRSPLLEAEEEQDATELDPEAAKTAEMAGQKGKAEATPGGEEGDVDPEQQQQDDERMAQQTHVNQQLLKMADIDKDIAKIQPKLQAGRSTPADVNKLMQLLQMKKNFENEVMRAQGVPVST